MAKSYSFEELNSSLSKLEVAQYGAIMSESEFIDVPDWISLGNYALNAQISGDMFKGFPAGRITVFQGLSGTGKSFMCLNACREAQLKGYYVIYFDTEAALDKESAERFGIDSTKLRHQPIETIKEVTTFCINLFDDLKEKMKKGFEIPKLLIILDSLGNLSSNKAKDDARSGNDKADMSRAKEIRNFFKMVSVDLGILKAAMICTNHTYAAIGAWVPTQISSGGEGIIYNASVILELSKAQLKEDGKTKSGIIVKSKPKKNRFASPDDIEIHLSFLRPMNKFVGLHKYVTWENCGIASGEYEKEIIEKPVLDAEGNQLIARGKPKVEKVETGKMIFVPDGKDKIIEAKEIAVKHLGTTVPGKELFTAKVFTPEFLEKFNEDVIKPKFALSKQTTDIEELSADLGLDED